MNDPSRQPLHGLRVLDLSGWIAGGYCSRLLADGGADVVRVESSEGVPLRAWSASGAPIPAGSSGALFNFLAGGARSIALDDAGASDSAALGDLEALLAAADVVVWSPGNTLADDPAFAPHALRERHPHLTITAITPFGLEGPWAGLPASELTLQAWSGGIIGLARGNPDRAPVHVGGQITQWLSGVNAAIGTLASRRRGGPRAARGELIDVSMLEVAALGLTYYPVTFNDQLGRPMRRKRYVPTPGVAAAKDGLVGLGVGTGQQWLDFAAMVGHEEWTEDPKHFLDRSGLAPEIDAWIAERDMTEVLDLAGVMRIPNAPIVNGQNAPAFEHFVERGTFRPNATDGALNPAPPARSSVVPPVPARPAPALGESSLSDVLASWSSGTADDAAARALPFAGLRVLDMTAYWAGPLVGHQLALLGAEVIHLESPKRPDGVRLVGGVPQSEPAYWERGPIFSALNTNKKSLTLDLNDPRGLALAKEVIATCDVVVENFTPRVLEQLGLTYEALRALREDLVMVRMPGFGLDGPWRELAAFAFVIEDASGLTWLTGHPDEVPIEPYCVGDPNAGLHALYGLILALEHRDRTGEGSLVEAAMVDAALSIAAEQVIEHSAYGALLARDGNRGPCAAPQNVYRAAQPEGSRDESWVAIAVTSDAQWLSLRAALGEPAWANDDALSTHAGRMAAHDDLDKHLQDWCGERTPEDIVQALWPAGVPVAPVTMPHAQPDLAQLASRGFFETVEHPVAGTARYATLPMHFSCGPDQLHVRHAPLLGEHSRELLGALGHSAAELDELEAAAVIGCALRPVVRG